MKVCGASLVEQKTLPKLCFKSLLQIDIQVDIIDN